MCGTRDQNVSVEGIRDTLDTIKVDTLAFISAFKTLKIADENFSLEDVRDLELTTVFSKDISKEDTELMAGMYNANYKKYPRLAELLVNKFRKTMIQEGNRIALLRRNGKIIAFYGFSPTESDGVLYCSSFNVDPTYQGALLGETLLQESVDAKAKDNILIAECNPRIPVSANYIERGFIATEKDRLEEVDILIIVRNDAMNKELFSRSVTSEEIISNGIKRDGVKVYSVPTRDIPIFNFDFVGTRKNGKTEVLTRYIKDRVRGMTYLVTEELADDFIGRYFKPQEN